MKIKTIKFLSTLLFIALGTSGCAINGQFAKKTSEISEADSAPQRVVAPYVLYDIKPGDSLALIAKRLTGEVDNWPLLATYNDIRNPGAIVAGDVISIPTKLLQNTQIIPAQHTQIQHAQVQQSADLAATIPVITPSGIRVARILPSANHAKSTIKAAAVNANRRFELQRIDRAGGTALSSDSRNTATPKVRVNGSYYPVGIYEQPANYSSLIRRVAPGSVYELEAQIDNWYKIKTEQGFGYVRNADVMLIP